MKRFPLWTGLILGLFLVPSMASAMMISFNYMATGNGGSVFGTFGYDTSVVDVDALASIGDYPGSGFISGSVSGGPQDGAVFSQGGLRGIVLFGGSSDELTVTTSGGTSNETFVNLRDSSASVFFDDSLPNNLNLLEFDTRELALSDATPGVPSPQQIYTLTSIARVPEPRTHYPCGFRCRPSRARSPAGTPKNSNVGQAFLNYLAAVLRGRNF